MSQRTKGRELALRILYGHDLSGWCAAKEDPELNWWNPEDPFYAGREPQRFGTQLFRGVLDHLDLIDTEIASTAEHWALKRLTPVDRNLIRIGVYEIRYRPDIPAEATINELIELAKVYGEEDSGTFINGILDSILKATR
ncbi:MAG: transcription antitermination factor NusB [bacterium]